MVPIIGVKHSINLVLMPSPTTITNWLNLIEKSSFSMRHNQFSHYKRSDTLAGDFMRYKPNQYLICDSYGNYYLRITLPVYMQPFFWRKRTFVRSLHTSNLRVARRKRDQIADEYHCLRESVAPVNSTIENTLELLRSKAKYAKTATRMQDTASSCPSLLKILEIYLTINSTKKKPATLAKARKAVEMFLSYRKKAWYCIARCKPHHCYRLDWTHAKNPFTTINCKLYQPNGPAMGVSFITLPRCARRALSPPARA